MSEIPKRILTIQDLSCVGQCSLTAALPVLSANGIEACALPTALLSNHTAFASASRLDLTFAMDDILAAWRKNHFKFDAFLLGYLASVPVMDVAKRCFQDFSKENSKIILDPAFGDHGKLYSGFDQKYVTAMAGFIASADILLPNLTEACFLTKTQYTPEASFDCAMEAAERLAKLTPSDIVLTGIERDGKIGELIYSGGTFSEIWGEKLPHHFHGTGDLFAAAFTAAFLQTKDIKRACASAGSFVASCIRATDTSHSYGVSFESVLHDALPHIHNKS